MSWNLFSDENLGSLVLLSDLFGQTGFESHMPDLVAIDAEALVAKLAFVRLLHGVMPLVDAHVGYFRVFVLAQLAVNHLAFSECSGVQNFFNGEHAAISSLRFERLRILGILGVILRAILRNLSRNEGILVLCVNLALQLRHAVCILVGIYLFCEILGGVDEAMGVSMDI